MKTKLQDLIDFERINILLEGFNKATGFVTAILDIEGNVLSKSGWRQICTEFHRVHSETSKKCTESDTVLAGQMADGEKYQCYKCLNGLVDVAVPIIIFGEHIGNLFTGQFLFDEPDREFFRKQSVKYGFDEKSYFEALEKVPVISESQVKSVMDFLVNMTQLISEMTLQRIELIQMNDTLRKSEDELLKRSNFVNKIIDSSAVSMWISDDKGTVLQANPACLNLFGATEKEVIGKYNIFNDSVIEEKGFIPLIKNVFEKGEVANIVIDYNFGAVDQVDVKNATHKIVNSIFTPILDSNGKVLNVIVQTIDISDIKKSEEELRRSKMLLESSIESQKDMIILSLDREYRYLFFNKTHADTMVPTYGKRPRLGDCIFEYITREDDIKNVKAHYDKALAGNGHSVIEEYGDGEARFYYEVQYNPIYNEKKEIIGITSFAKNITERKQAEEEIIRLNEQLKQKVFEQTKDLKEKVSELERFHDATIDREIRMKELRNEIAELKKIN